MTVVKSLAFAAVCCLAVAVLFGGAAPFARIALSLGLPSFAGQIFTQNEWQGIAAYQSGAHENAAELFAQSDTGHFNAGVALARAGKFAASLEAFDRARAAYPEDDKAEANFDLIASIYAGLEVDPDAFVHWSSRKEGAEKEAPVGLGTGRAASTGDETTNSGANMGLPELISVRERSVRKVFDDRFMLANDRWLKTLADVPGEYLATRIFEEHKRRKALGIAQVAPEDPQ